MSKLDRIDAAIVELLMEDGRMSCAEVARRIGAVSERAVRYRIDRLVQRGVIHISAIPRPQALGYGVVADVWLEVEPSQIMEVAQRMATYDCVSYVACSTGEHDVSIQVVARDNAELYDFVTSVLGHVPGVRKTTTLLVPVIVKDIYDWHSPRGCTQGEP